MSPGLFVQPHTPTLGFQIFSNSGEVTEEPEWRRGHFSFCPWPFQSSTFCAKMGIINIYFLPILCLLPSVCQLLCLFAAASWNAALCFVDVSKCLTVIQIIIIALEQYPMLQFTKLVSLVIIFLWPNPLVHVVCSWKKRDLQVILKLSLIKLVVKISMQT